MAVVNGSSAGSVVRRIGAWLPHGWRDFWLQALVFWTFNASYELTRGFTDGQASVAFENARRLMQAERDLSLFVELDVQRWMLDSPILMQKIANWTYLNCQFTVSFGFLFWIYLRRNHAFYFVRNTILFADFIGLVGYATIPMAPPRFFTQVGFVDTLHQEAVNLQTGFIASLANPYAAMPSLHTAYAVTLGVTGVLVSKRLLWRTVWALYPGLVLFSIVSTGNHFVLDAVAGAFVALFAAILSLAVTQGVVPRRGRAPAGPLTPRIPAVVGGD